VRSIQAESVAKIARKTNRRIGLTFVDKALMPDAGLVLAEDERCDEATDSGVGMAGSLVTLEYPRH
jgi:hypothetical protein